MRVSPYYGLHNEKLLASYIYPNFLFKGYSLHTSEINEIWTNVMNILIECIEEKIGSVSIVNTLPSFCNAKELSIFYGNYFHRIEDRIPSFLGNNNEKYFLVTDKLPFAAKYLRERNIKGLFTTYTVVRPRSFALKPFLREEFIRYFQLIVSSKSKDKQRFITEIYSALSEFFKRINLHVVLANRPSESYYEKKSCFYAIWPNKRVVSVLQCGLLREEVVKTIFSSNDNSFILDIGGAQRLMASWLYANSDIYGIIYPEDFRKYDIMLSMKKRTKMNDQVIELCKKRNLRVLVDDSLGTKKINRIRNIAYKEGAWALLIQRIYNGEEFYNVFFRNGKSIKINSINKVNKWLTLLSDSIKNEAIESQKQIFKNQIQNGILFPSMNNKGLSIINEGLFEDETVK